MDGGGSSLGASIAGSRRRSLIASRALRTACLAKCFPQPHEGQGAFRGVGRGGECLLT